MGELSRHTSRQSLLSTDDTTSLTSFPELTTAQDSPPTSNKLQGLLDRSGRPSIFDERTDDTATDPQTLSAASAEVLENVIAHNGAASLIKRLATLLAERDAHITALTRLAEEYKVPKDRIEDATSRVKQAEERRLALASAAREDSAPLERTATNDSAAVSESIETSGGTIKGLTRLFAGNTLRRQPKKSPASSRSTSQAPVVRRRERPQSIDARSVQSNDSAGWVDSLFGTVGTAARQRHDSGPMREPVEMTAQHDPDELPPTLQKRREDPKEAAWNKFLLSVTKARSKNGQHEQANGGGLIGPLVSAQKKQALGQLLVTGIPMQLRQYIWIELSNTESIKEPGAYEAFATSNETIDPNEIEAIVKDVPRTLTQSHSFYTNRGYNRLKELLVAFVGKYESLGYTQGLNTIAGYLLLAIPENEDAFWLLCNMVDSYFPKGYFARKNAMTGPLADNVVLRGYIKDLMPQLAKHLDDLDIPSQNTLPLRWFFTAFSNVLEEDALMRVWDIWLCLPGQKTFLFNVALAILMQNASGLLECENEGDYWSYLDDKSKCKVGGDVEWVNELIKTAVSLRKKLEDVEKRRGLEAKLLQAKSGSSEALYTPDVEETEAQSLGSA